jgi:hypothetical protein
MKQFIIIIFSIIGLYAKAQSSQTDKIKLTGDQVKHLMDQEKALKKWKDNLLTPGVEIKGKQMIFSEEAKKLIKNKAYRIEVFSGNYTFQDVASSLQAMEFQKAIWQMLYLYPDNKQTVLSYIYAYDKLIPTDQLVIASFYTYAFFDPKITTIADGKPMINRPDIFEEYFRRTKEIVAYIQHFRSEAKAKK